MKILFALLVGLILAFALFLFLPIIQEGANQVRQRFYFWLARHNPRLFARVMMASMAAPANALVRATSLPYSDVTELITQHNNLVASFRGVLTKMDLDAGITDANYFLLWADAANAASPKQITAQV